MSGNYLSMLKKRSWQKTLAIAVTAGILAGGYSTAFAAEVAQTAAEKTYNKTLTGVYNEDKATYKDVLSENNGQYNFGEGAKVTIDAGDVLALDFDKNNGVNENIVLSAKNGSITLKSASQSNTATQIIAARMTHVGNFTFDAADTNIIASSNNKSHAATGILVEGSDTHGQTAVNVKGNLNVNASGSGADSYSSVAGVLAKGDGVLTVDGNLVMKDEAGSWGVKDGDKSSYFATTGIKTDFDWNTNKGGIVNVKGLTDLVIDGSGVVVQQSGLVNLDGDVKIKTNKDSGKVAYSVAANSGGVVNVNMNAGRDNAGDKTVTLEGNVGAISGFAPNATVNIGLSNEQSSLHGVVVNTTKGKNIGQVNLYVNNNALWTNESYGAVDRGFTGSNVGKFVGGSDASHAGFVLQKDSRPLTIGNYSGHTVLVYEHTGDGSEASHFAAGDTHIKNAAAGSGIVVSTDNNGIDTGNTELVNKVLNNLAGKLYYDAFATGEKNLNGVVQIASGLTGSSVSKVVGGDITFSEADGKGQYVTAPTIKTDFTTSITGVEGTDKEYVDGGIYKNGEYIFGQDSNINIATSDTASGITAKGNVVIKAKSSTLNLNSKGKFGIDNTVGFSNKNNPYNVTITAKQLNISHENEAGRAEGIHILNGYSKNDQTDKVAKVVINGDTNINAYGVDYTLGAYVVGNSLLEIDGNVAMKGQGDKQWGIDNDGTSSLGYHSISGLYAGATYYPNQAGGKIVVKGNVDLAVNGTGVLANGNGSSVVINGGGTILTNKDNKDVHYALAAENGSVSMNMNKDNTAAGTNKVDIKGNIGVLKSAANENDTTKDTILNLGLSTADSVLTGVAVNNFTEDKLQAGFKPQLNMYVSNGATWNNEVYGNVFVDTENANNPESFKGSMVDKFVGGSDLAHAGVIVQKDTNKLSIGNYSGHTYLVYEHTGDGTNATDFAAGDTHIKNAAVGSGITMVTDNTNGKIDVNNYDQVQKVLNNLAGKLYYDAYATGEKNLTGKVQIASGLTGSAISQDLASGDMGFNETTGQGNVVGETIKPQPKPEPPAPPKPEPPTPGPGKPEGPQLPGNVSKGDYETLMMYGARAAMVDSMVAWRDTTAESFVRADELHKGAEDGAWVRINRGKVDYSGAGTEINGNFYGVQTGFDKSMGDGWTAGLMFDYRDGDSDYKMGSEGEHKLYGMGIYGTKDLGSNDYIDVVAKFGKVENDFIARNETGKELSGEYSAAAYSMSAQYGKRFEDSNGGYFEPQAQLTWSHVNSDTYDAHCGDQVMNIDQTAFDSFVGRLGVQAGQITDNGQAYVRLSVAHEFAGDIDGVYLAKDGGLKTTQYNAGDTWSELNIGGSYKLSKCANFYADITKTLTGDYKQDWKFNAGMSFSF